MEAATWHRIEELALAAEQLAPEERARFLAEACAEEPGLHQQVERFLDALVQGGNFLDEASWSPENVLKEEPPPPEKPSFTGRHLGAYQLQELLSRGGMGDVYKARRDDGHYRQNVAVKIIRQDLPQEAIRRFRVERQILARLSHPNIAELFDGGATEEGLPYLVMELVEGQPIDAYCDQKRLSVEARIALFRQVCSAVQFAHSHLLVHRDLKPANLLVTEDGVPKLLDFGIAKLLDPDFSPDTLALTRTDSRLMTLRHASPEQILGGAITTATDVYGLGLLLFELLTGRYPYRLRDQPARHEIERAICEQDITLPSQALAQAGDAVLLARESTSAQLRRKLKGDLDTILAKALAKRPQDRYSSAGDLLEDLERHQRKEPVKARRPTLKYRASAFVRRHRLAVAIVLTIILSLSFLSATLSLQADRIAQERDRADRARNFLVGVFSRIDPEVSGDLPNAREILDRASASLDDDFAAQPLLAAEMRGTLGQAYEGLGLYDQALAEVQEALDGHRARLGDTHLETARSRHQMAQVLTQRRDSDDLEAAIELDRRALEEVGRHRGRDHPELVPIKRNLGEANRLLGQHETSETHLEEALRIAQNSKEVSISDRVSVMEALASLKVDQGDYEAAEIQFADVVRLLGETYGESHPRLILPLGKLGDAILNQGRYQEGADLIARSLRMLDDLGGPEHPKKGGLLLNLAFARSRLGNLEEAESLYRETLAFQEARLGPRHPDLAITFNNLGITLRMQGKLAAAKEAISEAYNLLVEGRGEDHPTTLAIGGVLAETLHRNGELDAGLAQITALIPRIRQKLGEEHPSLAFAFLILGRIEIDLDEYESAEQHLKRALALRRLSFPADHVYVGQTLNELGRSLAFQGRRDEAEALLLESLEIYRKNWPEGHPTIQQVELQIEDFYEEYGR